MSTGRIRYNVLCYSCAYYVIPSLSPQSMTGQSTWTRRRGQQQLQWRCRQPASPRSPTAPPPPPPALWYPWGCKRLSDTQLFPQEPKIEGYFSTGPTYFCFTIIILCAHFSVASLQALMMLSATVALVSVTAWAMSLSRRVLRSRLLQSRTSLHTSELIFKFTIHTIQTKPLDY